MDLVLFLPAAGAVLLAFVWLKTLARAQAAEARAGQTGALEAEAARLREANAEYRERAASLEAELDAERRAGSEKLEELRKSHDHLTSAFKAISAEALQSNHQAFLQIATETLTRFQEGARTDLAQRQSSIGEIVKPLQDCLRRVDDRIGQLEVSRTSAYSQLTEQVKSLSVTQAQLQSQTSNLVKALRSPATRGRWGEMQLQRVVELAGMVQHCDFSQQSTLQTEDGRLRPDLIVHMPGGRRIVVDAKAPLSAYLDGIEADDEGARRSRFAQHASQVRAHITKLAARNYWAQLGSAPEFVVAFLPGEPFFSAALEHDHELIEYGVASRVLPATPTTLIALLLSVAHGWRQEKIAQNATEISALGKEIYERLRSLGEHFSKVGSSLDRAVENYNKAAGALESRVLVSARRMREYGVAAAEEMPDLDLCDRTARALQAAELLPAGRERPV